MSDDINALIRKSAGARRVTIYDRGTAELQAAHDALNAALRGEQPAPAATEPEDMNALIRGMVKRSRR